MSPEVEASGKTYQSRNLEKKSFESETIIEFWLWDGKIRTVIKVFIFWS